MSRSRCSGTSGARPSSSGREASTIRVAVEDRAEAARVFAGQVAMNIYLCGPMGGYPDNAEEVRRIAKFLTASGHVAMEPTTGGTYREYLAADCAWICEHAEAVAVHGEWQLSMGCRAEIALAEAILAGPAPISRPRMPSAWNPPSCNGFSKPMG